MIALASENRTDKQACKLTFKKLCFQMTCWLKRRSTEKLEMGSIWLSSSFMATKLVLKNKKLTAGHGYFKATNAYYTYFYSLAAMCVSKLIFFRLSICLD